MGDVGLRIFILVWLSAIMPSLGILPLLHMTGTLDPGGVTAQFTLALLRELRGLVLPDPVPEHSHLPFYALAPKSVWLVVIIGVFVVSAACVHYLRRGSRIDAA